MRGFCVIIVCVGVLASWVGAQFLNNRPYPTYSLESMPDTGFTCQHKIVGSYYADIETQCQMFHICVRVAGLGVQDFRFLCPNGTAFDQDHQICAEWEDVDCDSSTLYYASDNFDLYRIGSGFESKAVKYGEEEEVFSLQRAETGDIRINRDQETHRVNQQKDISSFRRPKAPQRNDDEIFKGSSSSNFFNNRNGGKEVDDDDDDKNVNYNQDRDQEQRRKVNRHQSRRPVKQQIQQTAAPQLEEVQTQRSNRPTGFINNFAGSVTTAKPSVTTEQYRVRQNVRQKQYNNADNFRQQGTTKNFDEQNYPSTTYTISTPAPFRTQQAQQPTTYSPKKIDYVNTQPQQQQKTYTKEPENYPSNFPKQRSSTTVKYDDYDVTKVKNTFEKKPTSFKQNEYPTTFAPKTAKPSTFNAQNTFPSTFSPRTNSGYTQISQQTTQQQKQTTQQQTTQQQRQTTQQQRQTTQQQTTQQQNTQQYNTQSGQYNSQYNTQSTQYNTQPSQRTQNTQYTTQAPQSTQQQYNTRSNQYNNENTAGQRVQNTQQYTTQAPQSTQQQYNSQYNTQTYKTQQYNTQTRQYTTQAPQSSQTQNNQQYNTQNGQYNTQQQYTGRSTQLTTSKPSPFTQYTPTVPKISSTTPVSRSNRFDETQYDDGSYNSKYDSYDGGNDEFLKTAHSTNIASSRNELAKSAKPVVAVSTTAKPYYESPRPFSVSQNTPKVVTKVTEEPKTTARVVQNVEPAVKKEKNASYDYAYYDSNTQNEPEYEIDTDFKKSTVKN